MCHKSSKDKFCVFKFFLNKIFTVKPVFNKVEIKSDSVKF